METLWESTSQNLKYKAVGGAGAPRYRLTAEYLHFESGLVRTQAQQVRTVDVVDVDVRQSLQQKALGVGTVVVRAQRLDGQSEEVVLDAVPDPRGVQQLLNHTVRSAREYQHQVQNTRIHSASGPAPAAPPTPPPPAGPPAGWYQDPHGSGGQRWWDGTRWTEHVQG